MLEIHFVHGFLGFPGDWIATIEAMDLPASSKTVTHDLLSDFLRMEKGPDPFLSWSHFKEEQWRDGQKGGRLPKFFVGFSLGGRLLLHLNPRHFCGLVLVSSHPGLSTGQEDRRIKDQWWAERVNTFSWEAWLKEWNQQEVFSGDKVRPDRRDKKAFKKEMSETLKFWSLGCQEDRSSFIKQYREKIYWIHGENDLKFKTLRGFMEKLLPESHIFEIPDAGHGVLFDNPQALGEKISEWFHIFVSGR